jgi:hypothetical protein
MARPLMSLDMLHRDAVRLQIVAPGTRTVAGPARGPDVLPRCICNCLCDLRKHCRRHSKTLLRRHRGRLHAVKSSFSTNKDRSRHEAKHNPNILFA